MPALVQLLEQSAADSTVFRGLRLMNGPRTGQLPDRDQRFVAEAPLRSCESISPKRMIWH
jgi:hypothetical protein